jgi:cyclophilin family peptidyl-prolyl cis-trans isomerase
MSGNKNRRPEVDDAIRDVDFKKNKYQIQMETSKGTIMIDLWPELAPGHCRNIIGLARIGYYDGLSFHRVIPGFVIQGGCPVGTGTGGPGYTIDAEFNDKPHDPGVLSMARTQDPNSAGSQFFLCLAKVPYLDKNYTAFGKTTDDASLDVVKAIGAVKTDSRDKPTDSVNMTKVTVVSTPL